MIAADEQALVCDLAEVYHIFDFRSLPVKLVATLSSGLRDDSRIKMILNEERVPRNTLLLAGVCDRLSLLIGMLGDSKKRPELITDLIFADTKPSRGFASGKEFLKAWNEKTNGGN